MEDIHDIKGPLELTFNYFPLIILFAILFLLLILLIYLSFKRKKSKQFDDKAPAALIKLSPKDFALTELERIKTERLIELNKYDIFYNRITGILKRYLFEQYKIETDSKTSLEIIIHLKALKLNYDFVRMCELCLKDLDFAKYSVYKTSARDMTESLDLIYSLFRLESKLQSTVFNHNQ